MARVTLRGTRAQASRTIRRLAKSDVVREQVRPHAEVILAAARRDPNPEYVAGLRLREFVTDRIVYQVGAAPVIGARVEAKRGTLRRALGEAGF